MWKLPRQTHRYFVDNLLSCGLPSIRAQVLNRYAKFVRSLLSSPSREVAVIARITATDASSNTGSNILNMRLESKICPVLGPLSELKEFFLEAMPVAVAVAATKNDVEAAALLIK